MDSDVLIVGAGPTGLTLAIDLGQRGVRCTLIEQKPKPAFLPKMERINARSMEIYRRMGLSEKIRAAGLRDELTFTSFRHGGFTEAADADLTDAEIRAQGRHRSAKVLPRYAKRTMKQVKAGAKKRRAVRTKVDNLSE